MDENIFWLRIWQSAIAGVVLMALVVGSCSSVNDYRVAEVIKAGADPQKAKCAIGREQANYGICQIIASKP